jgi:hypothetical protein
MFLRGLTLFLVLAILGIGWMAPAHSIVQDDEPCCCSGGFPAPDCCDIACAAANGAGLARLHWLLTTDSLDIIGTTPVTAPVWAQSFSPRRDSPPLPPPKRG